MHLAEGLEVFIKSAESQESYEEYDKPGNTPLLPDGVPQKYIEAQNGAEFIIVVRILPSFKSFRASALSVKVKMDNGSLVNTKWKVQMQDIRKDKGVTVKDFSYCMGGQWFRGRFTFAALELDENISLGKDEVKEQVASLGRIEVTICRGSFRTSLRPRRLQDDELGSGIAGKEIMKDHGISHFIKPGNPVLYHKSEHRHHFSASKGKNGEPFRCIFHYRSRFSLERLGITPIDPIVKPPNETLLHLPGSTRSTLAGAAEASSREASKSTSPLPRPASDEPQQNREAGLTDSERNTAAQTGVSGSGITRIKREHEDASKDALQRIPAAKRAKLIDLTEDDEPEPNISKPDGTKPAPMKLETQQEKPAASMADIAPLGIIDISDDKAEAPKLKTEPSTSHPRANLSSWEPTKQEESAEVDEKDLEFELCKIAIRRREVEIEQQEIEIKQQLHRLRRSRQ